MLERSWYIRLPGSERVPQVAQAHGHVVVWDRRPWLSGWQGAVNVNVSARQFFFLGGSRRPMSAPSGIRSEGAASRFEPKRDISRSVLLQCGA